MDGDLASQGLNIHVHEGVGEVCVLAGQDGDRLRASVFVKDISAVLYCCLPPCYLNI